TTALDVTIQAQILALIRELKAKFNTAVVLITHDLGVVAEFCDKIAVVYGGRVVESGTVEDIFEGEKNHPYTKGLINCIPDLTSKSPRLHPIPGHMGDPRIKVAGCAFAPRCPYAVEKCRTVPPDMTFEGGHGILCHMYSQEGLK
ncbi:MAG TPA: ABC transporter ATP-binding protein, partial [Candidatus Ornithospirochaeta stercorigallinarum]|nr:ABC transporter ATP-binding protein [Candidatus Ornithospirochaeta stercorigallinarum]